MPRKARIDGAGALHHIMARGIEGQSLFKGDPDRERFLEKLGAALKETGTPCYAWVLMRNHVHLLLRTGRASLAGVMRRVLTSYAMYFNRRYRRYGHLFQNRYKSILCEEDAYLKQLVRYIHLNPIWAKVVESVNDLKEYRFCGHAMLMGKLDCDWHDGDYVLRHFGVKLREARRRYEAFVDKGVGEGHRPDLEKQLLEGKSKAASPGRLM